MTLKNWWHNHPIYQRISHFWQTMDSSEAMDALAHEAPDAAESDPEVIIRRGMNVVIFGFLGFVVWASFAPLDQGIVAQGVVTVESNRKTVQHLRGGIVEQIFVKGGDVVRKGDPLVRLNETQVKSELGWLEAQYIGARATEARLVAERDHLQEVTFPEELLEHEKEPRAGEYMRVQRELFLTRRKALEGERAIVRESIAGQEEQIQGLTAQINSKSHQIQLLDEELASLKKLLTKGFVARSQLFERERALADVTGSRGEDQGRLASLRKAISEQRLKLLQIEQGFQKEVQTQLEASQKEATALHEKLLGARDDLDRVTITSPDDGYVMGIAIHTIGGIVTPGQELMYIVPHDEALLLDIQIQTQDVDKIHAGMAADVRLTAFNTNTTPVVPGKVRTVSADRIVDPHTGMPYYSGRVEITEEGMSMIKDLVVQPGMPADVIVKAGERTFMGYFFKPLFDRFARSMKEE